MRFRDYGRLAAVGAAVGAAGVQAAGPEVMPAGGLGHRRAAPATVTPAPIVGLNCPPGQYRPGATPPVAPGPGVPGVPYPMPGSPATPPVTPGTPATPGTTPEVPPVFGANPNGGAGNAAADALADGSLAQATQRGGSAEVTALPQVFGDLLGGYIAGPLPARLTSTGQLVTPIQVVTSTGQLVTLGGTGRQPTVDEILLLPAPPTAAQIANGRTVGLLPPPGTVFAGNLRDAVSRVPLFTRGAFKITENDTPRPTTRAYLTYNFYDQILNTTSGPGTPRVTLHQEVFGYEKAFADRQFSVGIRLPYNQLVSPGFLNDTSLGDITLISKAVLLEDRATGNLLSGGLSLTIPTATNGLASTTTGRNVRGTLIQPYLGYIYTRGNAFVQGFSSIVAPTDPQDVTFIANDIAVGYKAYTNPGNWLSGVIPVAELHVNDPLNHRGFRTEPVGFADQVTVLGGLHTQFYDRSGLGFAVGAPVTGPRPFSLQATVQYNLRF